MDEQACAHCARAAPTYTCNTCEHPICARCSHLLPADGHPLLQCLECSAALLHEAPAPPTLCSHCENDDPDLYP